jgi:hypothetical protein
MIIGISMIVVGYAVFYWGLHHFKGVDCPDGQNCHYSVITLLGMDKFHIPHGAPVQYG